MRQDRFLLVILLAILLLAATAVGLFLTRQRNLAYGPDDTPAGVVRNYVLALNQADYERAYGYLLDTPGRPSYDSFRQSFLVEKIDPSNVAVEIGAASQTAGEAVVDLTLIHASSGPFNDAFRENSRALLELSDNGEWKISSLPYPLWGFNWYAPTPFVSPKTAP
jgi:hypothetical protein